MAYFFLGDDYKALILVSMIMVGVATYSCGKYIFKDRFENAKWHWGKPQHYLYAYELALLLWLFPSFVELLMGVVYS